LGLCEQFAGGGGSVVLLVIAVTLLLVVGLQGGDEMAFWLGKVGRHRASRVKVRAEERMRSDACACCSVSDVKRSRMCTGVHHCCAFTSQPAVRMDRARE